jgi:hypothetical protein
LHDGNGANATQTLPTAEPLAMKAQAMRSPKGRHELETRHTEYGDKAPDDETVTPETSPEADEDELDESNLQDADDDRWDVFIFDDECDPLPDYGDFWFPD